MARRPTTGLLAQYAKNAGGASASGYWLKFFSATYGASTSPITMYTQQTGGVGLAKCKLNTRGEPISDSGDDDSTFIPYIDGNWDAYIFFTEADADANNTVNSIYLGTNIEEVDSLQSNLQFASVATLKTGDALNRDATVDFADYVGRKVATVVNNTTSKKGGAEYIIKTEAQRIADGDVIDGYGNHYLLVGTAYCAIILKPKYIEQFGAYAGLSDNSTCVNAAFNSIAKIIRNQTSGVFEFQNPITCKSNITIELTNDCEFKLANSVADAAQFSGKKALLEPTDAIPSNIHIKGGYWNGNKAGQTSASAGSLASVWIDGTAGNPAVNCSISGGFKAENWTENGYFIAASPILVENVYASNNSAIGHRIGSPTYGDINGKIDGLYGSDNADAAYLGPGVDNVFIENLVDSTISNIAVSYDAVTVGGTGVKLGQCDGNVITNINSQTAYWSGLHLQACNNNQISNIQLYNSADNGILVSGSSQNNKFDDFLIDTTGDDGIQIQHDIAGAQPESSGNKFNGGEIRDVTRFALITDSSGTELNNSRIKGDAVTKTQKFFYVWALGGQTISVNNMHAVGNTVENCTNGVEVGGSNTLVLTNSEFKNTYINLTNKNFPASHEGWVTPTYINSWTDGATRGPCYFRRTGTKCVIRGFIQGGTAGNTAFILPADYRPLVRTEVEVAGTTANVYRITILTDGQVIPTTFVGGEVAMFIEFETSY